jgi:hypothetical protein
MSLLSLARKKKTLEPLFAVILGASGSGKSSAAGTIGLPTLYIRTPVESHGGVSASTASKRIFGEDFITEIDIFEGAKNADQAWKNLLATLADPELPKQFGAVVIDSLTDLQLNVIHNLSEWKEQTTTAGGKINKLAVPGADTEFLNDLINVHLKKLHAKGVHVILLAAAVVVSTNDDGTEITAKPGLAGTNPAALVNRSCPDVLLVNRIRNEEGVFEHNFLFYPKVVAEGKNLQGIVTKTEGFGMRISHLSDLPERAAARLDELIEYRKTAFGK